MKYIFLLSLGCISFALNAQIRIKGIVVDEFNVPLPYVSIGIPNANIGTYSLEDGSYQLDIENRLATQVIQFSHIGFKTKKILVENAMNEESVTLNQMPKELNEVVIFASTKTAHTLGNLKKSSSSKINISRPSEGAEVALLIESKTYPYVINKINLNVVVQNMERYSLRVKLYDVDQVSGLPGKLISNQTVQSVFQTQKGEISFFPEEYIRISTAIFISFEWLATTNDVLKIHAGDKQRSNKIFNRHNSLKCLDCSKIIYNNKKIHFVDALGETIEKIKLSNSEKKFLTQLDSELPRVSFQTTKSEIPTYYRYTSFGKWYRYQQSLIANLETLD